MKFGKHKFTFMVIPDANRQVFRMQLSAFWIAAAFIILIGLAISAAAALILYGARQAEVGHLKQKLAASTGQYEKIISEKDRNIGDLQLEVAELSDQAKHIQDKMADLSELETELKQIAGLETPKNGTKDNKSVAISDTAMEGIAGGTGGEDLPLTEEYVSGLLLETHQNFSDLEGRIEEIKPRLEETKVAVLKMQAKLAVTPTFWPTDSRKVTSEFGIRRDPFTGRARFHAGIDIGGNTGDPVYAAADGTVSLADYSSSHGNNILISHGNGLKSHYSHLSKIIAKTGTKVKKGDIIGLMGSTGRSTGPHLHYEVLKNGTQVDPQTYLKASRKEF